MTNEFERIIQKYRDISISRRDMGDRFERLMQAYLKTDPKYADDLAEVWLWGEFPSRKDFGGGNDTGIDLVARTKTGDYWAIQCKCYKEESHIDKSDINSFITTSGKSFSDTKEIGKRVKFSLRLWIDTTQKEFNSTASATIENQDPPFSRLNYWKLAEAPVNWQNLDDGISGKNAAVKKHSPKPHQLDAIADVHEYLKTHDRGKLIMACGTGKTFTSLRIAENEIAENGLVLFLVPSIALLGQTLREWKNQCEKPIHAICICSDSGVSKAKNKNDDTPTASVCDLAYPASTDVKSITKQYKKLRELQGKEGGNIVVFSTYQSIDVICAVQKAINRERKDSFLFDLIICDEAHRTTGVTLKDEIESAFVRVHDDKFVKGKKRIYMTATPRIYKEAAQRQARKAEAILCSMDDPAMYGEEMYRIGFGQAVSQGLLSDYKVIVLTVPEYELSDKLKSSINTQIAKRQELIEGRRTNANESIKNLKIDAEDSLKIIGCINALSKKSLDHKELFEGVDPGLMRSAVAFCQNIAVSKAAAEMFNICRDAYFEVLPEEERAGIVVAHADHVDGTMGAQKRDPKLQWLKDADPAKRECNILCNVRCLSEGVDVPSLDAVMFLSARNSQVDVVQSVGRVMRKAEGKRYGYIIIPVIMSPDADPEEQLSSDSYKVVWTVLNALRAHDERFDAEINKLQLSKRIIVDPPPKPKPPIFDPPPKGEGGEPPITGEDPPPIDIPRQLKLQFAEVQGMIYAKIVQKCGNRLYWEQWAEDVAKIAERHIESITAIIKNNDKAKAAFNDYIGGLRKNINPSVTEQNAIEMLAQHIITQPVFEALFEDYSFVKNNAVSKSLHGIIDILNEQTPKEDSKKLESFYASVQMRAEGIETAEGKQKIIVELYDKFFRTAFPKTTEQLGIVYTPVEVVDFIIQSVEDILQKEFNRSMTDENVHILDPFTGTGTFITRLLQHNIIKDKDLRRKYEHELHANEIVLLAYYIASINIENVFHDLTAGSKKGYTAFPGICLTDTFQLGETNEDEDFIDKIFKENSRQVKRQKKAPLRVIIGNPPYSVGQKSANDNAQNLKYPKLDARVETTYAAKSVATNKNSLYDSYIKAFRWSTDRLDPQNGGIICFVSNGAWLDGNSQDGFRSCLEKEFSSIYVFNLRGNCRTQGELRRKEAGNVFGEGSRTPIAITLLVKNPKQKTEKATIHYYDIGDYHTREKKLEIVKGFASVGNMNWTVLTPDKHNDWINFRSGVFESYIPLDSEKKFDVMARSFFVVNSMGYGTRRDDWVYNSSRSVVSKNMKNHVGFYNYQVDELRNLLANNPKINIDDFRDNTPTKISWSSSLIDNLKRLKNAIYEENKIIGALYRPYFRQHLYNGDKMIHRQGQQDTFFPNQEHPNVVICVSGIGVTKTFSCLISETPVDEEFVGKSQCFPLYWYEKKNEAQQALNLFDQDHKEEYTRHDAVSDFILAQSQSRYGPKVNKEDIFYYVYGILHSPEYRTTFANDLKKSLPRLPLVEKPADFWAFSKAGRELAALHLNYEEIEPPKGVLINGSPAAKFSCSDSQLIVNKMKFPAKGQKYTIIYNAHILVSNIPPEAYEYVVNGKPAIEWVMERYAVTTHKDSGITNNPNDWAQEHGNPRYILDLLLSVITVSVKTVEIVSQLPKVEWKKA